MSGHGVVAIEPDRLEAFADALVRAADEVLRARLAALGAVDDAGRPAPDAVLALSAVSARLRDLGHDTRRRLDIVRGLPWDDWPAPTWLLLQHRDIGPAYVAVTVADRLAALGDRLRSGDGEVDADDVAADLDRLIAVGHDPYQAAAALRRLGVDGLQLLYALAQRVAASAGDEYEAHLEARVEAITGLVLAASRTVDRPGGLPRSFVDELLPGPPPTPSDDGGDPAAWSTQLNDTLTAAGAGQYLAAAAARATAAGRATVILRGAGQVIAIGGVVMALIDGLLHDGEGLADGLVTGTLGVVGAFAGGPVGWFAGGMAVLFGLVLAVGRQPGRPPARTYPTDRRNPGGSHYERHVNGAGIPVAPTGV